MCLIIIALQEGELNQTSADKKLNTGNVSPATLANGNKQSNGYESPRAGRWFEAIFALQFMYTVVQEKPDPITTYLTQYK